MTDTYKQLVSTIANRLPGAGTPSSTTTLYTVPGATSALVSRIIVCNQTTNAVQFGIALVTSGGTVTNNYYWVAYDITIGPLETINYPLGIGLATGDFIAIYSRTASALSFTPGGIEIS